MKSKKGRYTAVLPDGMKGDYASAVRDADLLSLRAEAELLQTLIFDAVRGLDVPKCEAAWEQLEALAGSVVKTKGEKGMADRAGLAQEMADVVLEGVEVWKQVRRLCGYIDQKRALADMELKRVRAAAETMTSAEAMALVRALVDSVRKEFGDQPERVARVAQELVLVVGGNAGEAAGRAA